MTAKRRGRSRRSQGRYQAAAAAAGLAAVSIIAAAHILGLVLIVAIVGAGAYLAGRRARPASQAPAARQPRSAPPARHEPVQWTPRGQRIARPASVPAVPDDSAVRREASSGLANLGWPASTTREPVGRAIAALRDSGADVTTQAVLAAVLRDAGNRRFAAVEP